VRNNCILYCILFVFMLVLLCFCVAVEFSVNKDLYNIKVTMKVFTGDNVPEKHLRINVKFLDAD